MFRSYDIFILKEIIRCKWWNICICKVWVSQKEILEHYDKVENIQGVSKKCVKNCVISSKTFWILYPRYSKKSCKKKANGASMFAKLIVQKGTGSKTFMKLFVVDFLKTFLVVSLSFFWQAVLQILIGLLLFCCMIKYAIFFRMTWIREKKLWR